MTATLSGWLDHLAPATAPGDSALHPLDGLGLIRVGGADAEGFLQNMLSNDVRKLNAEQAQLTSQCTPKGRAQALFVALRQDDGFLLLLPRNNLDATMKRLRLFVLRSAVTIEAPPPDALTPIGLSGSDSPALLADLLQTRPPATDWGVQRQHGLTVIRYPGDTPRYLLLAPPPVLIERLTPLDKRLARATEQAWELADIEAGLPSVEAASREHFVPQWINLDQLDGVSFKKGCYPGQEVVARLHYLGKPNRRMLKGRGSLPGLPAPGDAILREDGEQIGEVVRAAPHPDGDISFLAVVHTGKLDRPARIDNEPVWLDTASLPETGAAHDSEPVSH